ncbi:MAG: hypothetical protein AMXMBFR58_36640 [Phycisphaerae bacterium]
MAGDDEPDGGHAGQDGAGDESFVAPSTEQVDDLMLVALALFRQRTTSMMSEASPRAATSRVTSPPVAVATADKLDLVPAIVEADDEVLDDSVSGSLAHRPTKLHEPLGVLPLRVRAGIR